jgi:hypothetical protein
MGAGLLAESEYDSTNSAFDDKLAKSAQINSFDNFIAN